MPTDHTLYWIHHTPGITLRRLDSTHRIRTTRTLGCRRLDPRHRTVHCSLTRPRIWPYTNSIRHTLTPYCRQSQLVGHRWHGWGMRYALTAC